MNFAPVAVEVWFVVEVFLLFLAGKSSSNLSAASKPKVANMAPQAQNTNLVLYGNALYDAYTEPFLPPLTFSPALPPLSTSDRDGDVGGSGRTGRAGRVGGAGAGGASFLNTGCEAEEAEDGSLVRAAERIAVV